MKLLTFVLSISMSLISSGCTLEQIREECNGKVHASDGGSWVCKVTGPKQGEGHR
jgi:hypothetical protein